MFKQFRTEIALLSVTILTILFMIFFNDTIKQVRLNELKLFLQKIDREENNLDHIGLVMEYRQNRERYNNSFALDNADIIEMRVQSILSTVETSEKVNIVTNRFLTIPALYSINFFRLIMGKAPIKNIEDNKSSVYLDIAYYYERNKYYQKALDIYQKALSEENMDNSQKAAILLHEGFCYSIIGDYKLAKSKYTTVIKDYGNESVAVTAAVLLRYLEGFIKEIDKVIDSEHDSVEKGVKLYNLIAYKESLKVLSSVEKNVTAAEMAKVKYFKGRCYEELSKKEKAINTYLDIIQTDPSSRYAKLANRRIYLAGAKERSDNGEKVKKLSLKYNKILNDNTLDQMVKEEVKIKKTIEIKQKKENLLEKELTKMEKITPIFEKEEMKSYDLIMKKLDNEIQKYPVVALPTTIVKREAKIRIFTTDGNIFIGTVVEETPKYINVNTMLGTIKIEKSQISKREKF